MKKNQKKSRNLTLYQKFLKPAKYFKANAELKKLKMMNQMSAESSVVRNYLDTLLSMPWGKQTKTVIDINKTETILDRDHYGLKKVKERKIDQFI